jgi:hypothetical protein
MTEIFGYYMKESLDYERFLNLMRASMMTLNPSALC